MPRSTISFQKSVKDRFPIFDPISVREAADFTKGIEKYYANMNNEEMIDTIAQRVREVSASKEEIRAVMKEEQQKLADDLARMGVLAGIVPIDR